MVSVEEKILMSLKKSGRGTVFCANRFATLGSVNRLNKAMQLLTKRGAIIRVAWGVYCYPKMDTGCSHGVCPPPVDDVARVIAQRDKVRIAPLAVHAQNLLGLSQQMGMNFLYLTDGRSRTIKLENGVEIYFKHTSANNHSFKNKLAMLITLALRDFGTEHVTEDYKKRIQSSLSNEKREDIERDYALMPDWIIAIINECYDSFSQS